MFRSLRNAFLTGIVVILPLGVTIIIINFLLQRLGTPASNFFFWFLDAKWRDAPGAKLGLEIVSVIFDISLITLIGKGFSGFKDTNAVSYTHLTLPTKA